MFQCWCMPTVKLSLELSKAWIRLWLLFFDDEDKHLFEAKVKRGRMLSHKIFWSMLCLLVMTVGFILSIFIQFQYLTGMLCCSLLSSVCVIKCHLHLISRICISPTLSESSSTAFWIFACYSQMMFILHLFICLSLVYMLFFIVMYESFMKQRKLQLMHFFSYCTG